MNELNSFGNPEFLNDLLSEIKPGQQQTAFQARSDAVEFRADAKSDPAPDVVLDDVVHEIVEQFRLSEILEEACLATGATGAAIALARGGEIVCRATTGADAPDLGVCLDPHTGLSGVCIQTRQLQQCNDTETDPRVDPEACRHLGVRSIVILPLVDGNELLGVFEILSSRPNAFGQRDLDTLQAMSTGILPSRVRDSEVTAHVPPKGSVPLLPKFKEVIIQNKSHNPESGSGIPRREHASKRNDKWTAILGVLVIGASVSLGGLVGWRLGWQKATLQIRNSSPPRRASAPSKTGPPDDILRPAVDLQPSSLPAEESGHATGLVSNHRVPGATKNPAHLPRGGLTVHQGGKIIYGAPPSAPPPARHSQTSPRSPSLEADPSQE